MIGIVEVIEKAQVGNAQNEEKDLALPLMKEIGVGDLRKKKVRLPRGASR
jgi:hypothetical protein